MSETDAYTGNGPTDPFRDPVAGETAYIDPATMRAFAQAVSNDIQQVLSKIIYSFEYDFSPALGDPSGGQIRLDKVDQTAATVLYLSHKTADGNDLSGVFSAIPGSQIPDLRVRVQDKDDATKWQRYKLIGQVITQVDEDFQFPVEWLEGGLDLTGQRVVVVIRTGGE